MQPIKFSFAELNKYLQNLTAGGSISTNSELWTRQDITSLSPATCRKLTSHHWISPYGFDDIWNRQATWKLPLVQLLFLFTRQPFGWKANFFTIIHSIGDPINTVASLLFAIERCQVRANLIRDYCVKPENRRRHKQSDFEWKAFTLLLISYDEHGIPEGEAFLTKAL